MKSHGEGCSRAEIGVCSCPPREGVQDVIAAVRSVGRKHGYAIGVHGTLVRDIDLIAVPWTDEAVPPAELAEAVRAAVDGYWRPDNGDPYDFVNCGNRPQPKPHGRLGWSIVGVLGTYVDLSVMPPHSGDSA